MMESDKKRRVLLTEERRAQIVVQLRQQGRVVAADLSQTFGVSDDTIRRDLDALAEMGVLQRVHGGGLRRAPVNDDYAERQTEESDAKSAIARATAALIHPGQVVIMDGGTTSLAIATHLPADLEATIITTSPPVAVALVAHPRLTVITIGGRLYRYAMVAVGAETVAALAAIRADICILGVLAIHPEVGISVIDHDEAQVKRAMIASAATVIAPTIAAKLGTVAPFIVAPLTAVTHLVTETGIAAATLAPYQALGITIVQG